MTPLTIRLSDNPQQRNKTIHAGLLKTGTTVTPALGNVHNNFGTVKQYYKTPDKC